MPLKTVKVPKEMEQLFARAEEIVSSYFSRRKEDPAKGTIEIFDERYVLVRAAALSVEFHELVENLYGKGREEDARVFAQNILFDLAHAIGKADAKNFHEKMKLKDPIAKLSAGPIHFSHCGWAFVDIFSESRPTPDENYYLIYDHPYSFESDAWIRNGKRTDFPVCIMNAGYSSGWCEESFGVNLVASEILCKAKGDDCCRFIMAPPAHIEEHINAYMKERPRLAERIKGYEIPDFFVRKRLEDDLKKNEQKYRSIIQAALDGFWVTDAQGHFLDVNEAYCAIVGYTREELLGMSISDVEAQEILEETEQHIRKIFAAGSDRFETVHRRKDGGLVNIEVSARYLPTEGGQLVVFLRDITSRKLTEEAIKGKMDTIEKLNWYMLNREERIMEMKGEVNALLNKLGQQPKY